MGQVNIINSCTVGNNQICCFDQLSPEEIAVINKNSVEVSYDKGETICKQGSFASHIMMIDEGLAKIYLEGNTDTLILKILASGNIIGLSSLIEGNNVFQYSAQAYLSTSLKLIDINIFKDIIKNNGEFAYKVISLLSENSVITYGRFFCLTKKQTYGRLADILLCLSQRVYKKQEFPLQLNRKEIAELASMSIESTARILTKFKEENLISIKRDSIKILDMDKLSKISISG